MFSPFGAPIVEGFESLDNDFIPCNGDKCIVDQEGKVLIKKKYLATDVEEDTSDEEEAAATNEENIETEIENNIATRNNVMNKKNNNKTTTAVTIEEDTDEEVTEAEEPEQPDEEINEAEEPEEPEEPEEDEDEDDDVDETEVTEQFFGGNIEHFSNQEVKEKATSMSTLLKVVMVTCLFYVLAHKDAKKYLMKNVFKTIKPENYLYLAMVIFFVVFYVISIFL